MRVIYVMEETKVYVISYVSYYGDIIYSLYIFSYIGLYYKY